MCFSATASFVAAGATFTVGAAALSRIGSAKDIPMASMPIMFAVQQTIEGLLWLDLPAGGGLSSTLSFVFLLFAYVLWPVYVPIAVLLIEPNHRVRRLLLACEAIGIALGVHLLWWILTRSTGAAAQGHHIVYESGYQPTIPVALAYLAATGLPLALSTHRWVLTLGAVILVGSIVAYISYWDAFVSVWCFFAAAASAVIFGHFQWAHSGRPRLAVL